MVRRVATELPPIDTYRNGDVSHTNGNGNAEQTAERLRGRVWATLDLLAQARTTVALLVAELAVARTYAENAENDKEQLQALYDDLLKQDSERKLKIESLQDEITRLSQSLEESAHESEDAVALHEQVQDLIAQLQAARADLDPITAERDESRELAESLREERDALLGQVQSLRDEIERLTENYENRLAEMIAQIELKQTDIALHEQEEITLISKVKKLERRIAGLERLNAELETINGKLKEEKGDEITEKSDKEQVDIKAPTAEEGELSRTKKQKFEKLNTEQKEMLKLKFLFAYAQRESLRELYDNKKALSSALINAGFSGLEAIYIITQFTQGSRSIITLYEDVIDKRIRIIVTDSGKNYLIKNLRMVESSAIFNPKT